MEYKSIASMGGWFSWVDFYIFKCLLDYQASMNFPGGLCEIGVHHGKSFIPMVLFSSGSLCHVIDVFEQQQLNLDNSGSGNYSIFKRNLSRFHIRLDSIRIHKKLSTDVNPEDLTLECNSIRFFHIDGGHNFDVVKSDLRLALNCSNTASIIAIDDICRPEWFEVSVAVFGSNELLMQHGFVILAFGYNKLFLCHKSKLIEYRQTLLSMSQLKAFLVKDYSVRSISKIPTPIYAEYPLPEWGLVRFILYALKLKVPYLYSIIMNVIPVHQLKKLKKIIQS